MVHKEPGQAEPAARGSLLERLRAGRALRIEPVDFPGFDRVWVRELSGADRDRIARIQGQTPGTFDEDGWRGAAVAIHLCNEQGERELDPIENGPELNELPSAFLDAIIQKSNEVNGLTPQAVEAAKENFGPAPSSGSTSSSPNDSGE